MGMVGSEFVPSSPFWKDKIMQRPPLEMFEQRGSAWVKDAVAWALGLERLLAEAFKYWPVAAAGQDDSVAEEIIAALAQRSKEPTDGKLCIAVDHAIVAQNHVLEETARWHDERAKIFNQKTKAAQGGGWPWESFAAATNEHHKSATHLRSLKREVKT